MGRLRVLRKNLAMSVTARGIANCINFLSMIYLIRYLGQQNYGHFAVAFAFVNFFSFLMGPGFRTILLRDLGRDKSLLPSLMGNMLIMRILLSMVTFFVLLGVASFMRFDPIVMALIFVLYFWLFFSNLALQFRSLFYVFQDLDIESGFMLFEAALRAAWIGLCIYRKVDLFGFTVGFAALPFVTLLFSIAATVYKYRIFKFKITPSNWISLLTTGVVIGLVGLVSSLHLRIDIVMLSKLTGDDSLVGLYGAAFKLIEAPLFVFAIFSSVILPEFSYFLEKDRVKVYEMSVYFTKIFVILYIPSALLFANFSRQIITLVYGSSFQTAHLYFRALLPSIIFMYFNTLLGTILYASEMHNVVLRNSIYSLALNITTNFILIPIWGAFGAAVSTIVSEAFLSVLNLYKVKGLLYTSKSSSSTSSIKS